ncbi:MAG: hypothetical protein DBX38_04945 [Eubacteriales Family XIII. Incertae Sedis bacterium]|nr:MAG: hypothetical protein DBX38_07935 [Clostridiales Family XIII bacterium]PWM66806.1 MAG: hypothetical protein DBX38_04945 [Clostridiales Family XIII bacterium]
MNKFTAEKSFWDLFPDAELGIVIAAGINNKSSECLARDEITKELAEANIKARKFIDKDTLSECSAVSVWREAFQKFKKKKGNRSSIEALLSRVQKGNEVGPINPLVDIYNTMSLTYGLPCGGEDLDNIAGTMRLTLSENGGEEFIAIGDTENDPTLPGELCYLDDKGAVCRCWNWRDGTRTMLTEDSTSAFLIFESVNPERHDELAAAVSELADRISKYLGGEIKVQKILTKDDCEITL